jgi:hypothetical protein
MSEQLLTNRNLINICIYNSKSLRRKAFIDEAVIIPHCIEFTVCASDLTIQERTALMHMCKSTDDISDYDDKIHLYHKKGYMCYAYNDGSIHLHNAKDRICCTLDDLRLICKNYYDNYCQLPEIPLPWWEKIPNKPIKYVICGLGGITIGLLINILNLRSYISEICSIAIGVLLCFVFTIFVFVKMR